MREGEEQRVASGLTARPQPEANCGEKPSGPVDLGDALAEIAILRLSLEGAIIGSRIIVQQLERAEDPLLQWVYRQASANMSHDQNGLNRSRADFPFEGRQDLAKATGQ